MNITDMKIDAWFIKGKIKIVFHVFLIIYTDYSSNKNQNT